MLAFMVFRDSLDEEMLVELKHPTLLFAFDVAAQMLL